MDKAYVRTQMLPPQTPPVSERGAVKWLHENLFSGWLNSLLTVLGLAFVVWLVWTAFPWWWHGVWTAGSLGECRDIVAAAGAESGACWAVIRERWHQYLFGFYPQDSYWRPVLAFGLLFVALAPVLYWNDRKAAILTAIAGGLTVLACIALSTPVKVDIVVAVLMAALAALAYAQPRMLIWATALYPFTAFWLLWGGPIAGPIALILSVAVIVAAILILQPRIGSLLTLLVAVALIAVFFLGPLTGWISAALRGISDWGLPAVNSDDFGGFLLAFVIGVTSITASLPLGILLALGRRSDMFLVKTLSVGFIEFIRGVPLITLLFTASLLLQYFLPPQTNFDLILRVIILASLFSAAYLAEVIRGGLAALPRGQYEAADALGLDYWQAQRLIIMPQALKISIPGIVSTFIGLFKDTTLVSFVGLLDPLRGVTQIVRADINWKGIYWEPYIFVGVIFFLICFGMSRYSMYLENKLKTDHR
jgi:general L-amino acid transport system permease protein